MIMERKIGEIFEYNGEWYQCVEGPGCHKCDFNIDKNTCGIENPYCTDRSDKKDVVFKNLKKIGEPITVKGRTFQCLNSPDAACVGCAFFKKAAPCDKDDYIDGPCPDDNIWVEIKQNEMKEVNNPNLSNTENIGKNLKPFDLEAAKSGKPVCTRDGRKARIICFDSKNDPKRPIVALVENNGNELLYEYTIEGKERFSHISTTGTSDLMMLPEKKEGWVNVYYDNDASSHRGCRFIYDTKEEAIKGAGASYIATIKISWEE